MESTAGQPRDEEVDVFGMTDVGKVRPENEDHFLICSLHKTMRVHATSLPDQDLLPEASHRLGFLAAVADGLGGHARGEQASRLTVETVAHFATQCMDCYYALHPELEEQFLGQLHEAALRSHEAVTEEASKHDDRARMAATLTLVLTIWPRVYVVQVGDSRCYVLHKGTLHRLTRDQTLVQELIDSGAMTTEQAASSRLSHVLSSAIGGATPTPVTSSVTFDREDVLLLCTDGLTRHVSDDEIREHLQRGSTAEATGRALVDLALERGGEDNITVVIGRLRSAPGS